jgi:drug/metabolite transporter (DMT)-like permease
MAALLAAVSFAFYNIAGHRLLTRYDRWIVLFYATFSAAAFWMFVNPPWKLAAAHYSGEQLAFLAVFAVVSMLAPFSLYFAGLQYLEPTRAIVVSCLEPVFSIVLAALLLGEGLRPVQALGIVIVLAAIVIVQLPERAGGECAVVEPIE